uniref:Mesothelin a n=2 Tax=Mastacembelus armatus TaxID=205130 RepID=A0A3Q3L8M9_9TELE
MNGHFCDFAVEEFACASLSTLTADGLAALLKCNRSSTTSGSGPAWKLLLTKASQVLDEALDRLTNEVLDPRNPAVSMILNAIQEVRLDYFSPADFSDPAIIQLWFNLRLQPFLSSVSPEFLSCLTTKGLTCSTYQNILQSLTLSKPQMALSTQVSVYTHFIKVFLTRNDTADPSCSLNTTSSGDWLKKNLGGFSDLVPIPELQMLYPRFSPMDALSQLTVRQLAGVAATPGQLTSAAQVNLVMSYVPNQDLPGFFDDFSPVLMGQENLYPSPVRSAMLQVVFDRVNLADVSVSDSTVSLWLQRRLRPLLYNLSPDQVTSFFGILAGRSCNVEQQGIETLNSTISSLSNDTKQQIYNSIIQTLRGPTPLRCYGNNPSLSFYSFLQRSFMGFQFPRLTTFLSLMPQDRIPQLLNSIPPSALGDYLRRPDIVDNSAELSVIYDNYSQTQLFLETEPLPVGVRQATLPIVWPKALSSTTRSEVNAWFDRSLRDYLVFLTKNLISPNVTGKASCPAFQKFVSVLNVYNVTAADFVRRDVYNSIRAYLTSATVPKCYNPSDPELNSTAWFAEYIGGFMPFLTLEDLQTFGSSQVIQVFTVNLLNIALLNQYALPVNLTNYYTELIYLQDSNFNPFLLPMVCQCVAPGPAFSQLTAQQSLIVLQNLTTVCTDLNPQISAALAGNFGNSIDQSVIVALGSESTGMSTGQLKSIRPRDLYLTLGILSSVTGWNDGQARAIIEALLASGLLQIHSTSDLLRLGSLIRGVPPSVFSSISGYELISASQNTSFLANLMSSSQIIQETFVTQIISVSSNSEMIVQNVPDELATEITQVLLVGFSSNSTTVTTLNKKKWKRHQAEIFFEVIGVESATAELGSPNNLSSSVLQGFTCTGVRNIQKVQIKKLVKACQRKGKNRVPLVETQLTCMYNHIKGESDATSFSVYPPDMLLYYDYSLVPQNSCRSYFEQLADADFSVFSPVLSYKQTALFANARSCLGITSSLTKDNVMVLGNMCCTLDGSYITNSDPLILEKLKNCPDLTDAQAAAVQTLLLSGKTQYGDKSTWNGQTLVDLGMLPLYLPSSFYDNFDRKTKQTFLKYFLTVIKSNGVSRQKRRRLKEQLRLSNAKKLKRSIVDGCTVGTITQVTISSDTFPFNYFEISQFNSCLSATTVKDNLDAITMKVDEMEYLRIVLNKLQEAYGAGATIPEDQVQLLGPASRVATIEDINNWSITQIGTLSALMDPSNGQWEPSLAKAIISKYLSKAGNKLGSTELSAITGDNLCSLGIDVLKNISQQSLRYTNALNVSSCTAEKKTVLFTIASQAFITNTRAMDSVSSFQLTQSYLRGADLNYVLSLVGSNVNMDLATFVSMPENVVMNLTVNQVKSLLGANLATLKSYENQNQVQSWIRSQYQSELDTLQIGLTGGKADPTVTSSPTTVATTSSTPTTNTSPTTASGNTLTTTSTTKGDGTRLRADAGFSLLVLLMLFITSQHIVV